MSRFNTPYGLGVKYPRSFRAWYSMRARCCNPNNQAYRHYGGRGIKICERWENFSNFVADMGERPEGKSLDRFPNNDGDYEPSNCRWATPKQQANNRRRGTLPKDLAGKVFNRLTAIKIVGRHKDSGEIVWQCQCTCGQKTQVRKSALEHGRTKSCGCSRWRENNSTWSTWPSKRIQRRSKRPWDTSGLPVDLPAHSEQRATKREPA